MADRPGFNEYSVWSPNSQDRNGTRVDLLLLHTQESDGNADQLARWLQGDVGVSYHYAISEDPTDHGVTVVDVVDTDEASWSVLSANNRSINLCFAGSSASWSRAQWLKQSRAIDAAAYIAVQDCKKYGIPIKVLAPPYTSDPPGISDHKYVTEWLKDGTHTDVGPNFPWDVLAAAVSKYAAVGPAPDQPQQPAPAPALDYAKLGYEQLAGPAQPDGYGHGWDQLGGKTIVDYLAALGAKVDTLTAKKTAAKKAGAK